MDPVKHKQKIGVGAINRQENMTQNNELRLSYKTIALKYNHGHNILRLLDKSSSHHK